MRIVHDIDGPATVSGGGRPYTLARGQEIATGFRADVLILVSPDHPLVGEEEIHIEGDGRHTLNALRDAVRTLEAAADAMVGKGILAAGWNTRDETESDSLDVSSLTGEFYQLPIKEE